MRSKQLRERRMQIYTEIESILQGAEKEARKMSAEEEERWNRGMKDIDDIKVEIDRAERMERVGDELTQPQVVLAGRQDIRGEDADRERETRLHRESFVSYLRYGVAGMPPEQREFMHQKWAALDPETRALTAGTGSEGGFTVPEGFVATIEAAMLDFSGIRQSRAMRLATAMGNPLPWPTSNDTSNTGALLAESGEATELDIVFGQIIFGAFKYTSRLVRVSRELLQDTGVNLEGFLAARLGERLGRITNTHFTVGTGTAQPNGIVTASVQGIVGAVGQTVTVTYPDLVDLEHSVDPAYRRMASTQWMFHDNTLAVLKKIIDPTTSRPIWLPGIAVAAPDTILGYPYVINQDVPVMAANAKSILFGAMEKFIYRDVLGFILLRLVERYAEFFQVGFLAFSRHDSDLIDAGTNPIKHYANSAT